MELWRVKVTNLSAARRSISIYSTRRLHVMDESVGRV